jgi:hypothetical protein|eukprot:COSAG01_NODE_4080_length_5376_cov_171.292401_8_plen_50_part_00
MVASITPPSTLARSLKQLSQGERLLCLRQHSLAVRIHALPGLRAARYKR